MRTPRSTLVALVFCLLWSTLFFFPRHAAAEETGAAWVSRLVSVQGQAFVKRAGESEWREVGKEETFFSGDAFRVAADSRAAIVLSNESVLRVDQYTTLVFTGIEKQKTFLMELLEGVAFFFSRKARSLKVVTPFVNGVVEGTEFYVQVDPDRATLILYEGAVLAENRHGDLSLARGEAAVAAEGRAPRLETIVRARDAVQWALYYPPILTARPRAFLRGERDTVENADFYAYRAALSLSTGRIDRATNDIERGLALDAHNSSAMALRSIVAVVQNRKADALEDARKAVAMDGRSAAARIALSYALQARFDIEGAADAAEAATRVETENGLAWARLAELRLSLGDAQGALHAAGKAETLSPDLARVQTVLGYAYLTRIKTDKALAAFNRAIALDDAAPLPRLGSGLAKIRNGHLKAGRADIEIAAGLDPDNALIRSYLGKAYFDEKRDPLDARQFEMAKRLDPNDPTPWFYDAIRKQSINRPGEALLDMQKAIELNDNRAVYRSRLLLDEDLAARSARLGRIYNDLSFQEQALRQGWKSLEADPSNYSAHRLLADMYASRPRHEIARVSELLQAQLLQPLNVIPVRPQLAESNLPILDGAGPGTVDFNEFNPLFMRDRDTVQVSAVSGENRTVGGDAAVAGLHQWFSYSVGAFRYETDGFRENNDLTQDIYNLLLQAALTPRHSVQLAYRYKESENGDLRLRFDLDDFSENLREQDTEKIPRLGYHFRYNPNHHVLASFILNEKESKLEQQTIEGDGPFGPIVNDSIQDEDSEGYQAELQYLFARGPNRLITGAGYYDQELDGTLRAQITSGPLTLLDIDQRTDKETDHWNGYLYYHIEFWRSLTATVACSFDEFQSGEIDERQFNPKIGLRFQPFPDLTIRAAAFRTLKRSLISNQTIEPTHVAGFNQFFDDPSGTDAKRYGFGIDYQPLESLSFGGEISFRNLDVPKISSTDDVIEEEQNEDLHRFYVSWLPVPELALGCGYTYEHRALDVPPSTFTRPKELLTEQVPLSVAYFTKDGLFVKLRGRFIHQEIERYLTEDAPPDKDTDDFFLTDASVGYRLPKRYGILSVVVTNIFDTTFDYYGADFQNGLAKELTLQPERQVMLKFNVNI